ncbi:hypothetical protein M378DRAFT_172352 [Amanita muscaria Koide BX008]|uniref:Uncharacterized protein n=1 Tax=Amanita muscaria (strain Koide BX008) TaxID=946122 RepID=A0A0C2WJH5_AMAMK|nr:hypothetical protein M378DRAFT_172352 [Amanita muscaria Koide BX008]
MYRQPRNILNSVPRKRGMGDLPAASTASRTALLLCVEQLSTIMILFGSGNGFMRGSCTSKLERRMKASQD